MHAIPVVVNSVLPTCCQYHCVAPCGQADTVALLAEIVCASVVTRPFVILKQVQSSKYKVHQLVTAYTKQDKIKKKNDYIVQ